MERDNKYLFVEPPDHEVTIDFAGFCIVTLKTEPGKNGLPNLIRVEVKGLDDRVTILMDESIDLPQEDMRE